MIHSHIQQFDPNGVFTDSVITVNVDLLGYPLVGTEWTPTVDSSLAVDGFRGVMIVANVHNPVKQNIETVTRWMPYLPAALMTKVIGGMATMSYVCRDLKYGVLDDAAIETMHAAVDKYLNAPPAEGGKSALLVEIETYIGGAVDRQVQDILGDSEIDWDNLPWDDQSTE